jgi:uncharacterized protein YfaS (alpha-2-macroglobulin family)
MSYLNDNLNSMPLYGRLLLAASYAAARDTKTAIKLLGDNALPVVPYDGQQESLNYDTPLRAMAISLAAWNEIDPSSPNAVTAASNLLRSFHSSAWYTTQDAGWTMMSLADFYSHNRGEGNAELELKDASSKTILTANAEASATKILGPDINALAVTNKGTGLGYVTWIADGVPNVAPEPSDSGIKALVAYKDSNGFDVSQNGTVKNGERVSCEITLLPLAGEAKNLVAVLPLAGGLEIENPRVMDPNPSGEYEYNSPYYGARTEIRDDRLLLFVDYLPVSYSKPFTWKFTMRAVTSGMFTLPPLAVEGMYSPGTRSVGASSKITVE